MSDAFPGIHSKAGFPQAAEVLGGALLLLRSPELWGWCCVGAALSCKPEAEQMLHLGSLGAGILCVPFSLALEQAGVPGGDFGAVVLQLPGLARPPPPPSWKGIFWLLRFHPGESLQCWCGALEA